MFPIVSPTADEILLLSGASQFIVQFQVSMTTPFTTRAPTTTSYQLKDRTLNCNPDAQQPAPKLNKTSAKHGTWTNKKSLTVPHLFRCDIVCLLPRVFHARNCLDKHQDVFFPKMPFVYGCLARTSEHVTHHVGTVFLNDPPTGTNAGPAKKCHTSPSSKDVSKDEFNILVTLD